MIYGVSRNRTRGIGYDSDEESDSEKYDEPNTLQSNFVPLGVVPKGKKKLKPKAKAKTHSRFNHAFMYKYTAQKPKFVKNYGKINLKGHKKLQVPKDKIIYVAYILSSRVKKLVNVPGLWMLVAHDWKKAYVPKPRT